MTFFLLQSNNATSQVAGFWEFIAWETDIGHSIEVNDNERIEISQDRNNLEFLIPVKVIKDACNYVKSNDNIKLTGIISGSTFSASGKYEMIREDCLGNEYQYEQIRVNIKFTGDILSNGIEGYLGCNIYYKGVKGTKTTYHNGTEKDYVFFRIDVDFE